MKCSICFHEIEVHPCGWAEGHNAQPVAEGRCCGQCNDTVVVPVRIARYFGNINSNEGEVQDV
jgi:hypothetical protein